MKKIAVGASVLMGVLCTFASKGQSDVLGKDYNPIKIAAPFLTIAPDARSASYGDQGVASTADNSSQYWNSAKYPFAATKGGASYTYTPWLRNITSGTSMHFLSGFYKMDDLQSISASLRYFALNKAEFTDENNVVMQEYAPNELAFDVGYARKLSDQLSGGIVFRYIKSDATGNYSQGAVQTKAASTAAADVSIYYCQESYSRYNSGGVAFGLSISNIGPKISYSSNSEQKYFLPTTLRIGGRYTTEMQRDHKISFMLELSKLLVPTPDYDSLGIDKNASATAIGGMFSSFADAPNGFSEELKEFTTSIGGEYTYMERFSARLGLFNESKNKGNRKYFTLGLGLNYNALIVDLSYLVPTSNAAVNPLAKTFRFTIGTAFSDDSRHKSGRRGSSHHRRRR